jgi:hypothetical protein
MSNKHYAVITFPSINRRSIGLARHFGQFHGGNTPTRT